MKKITAIILSAIMLITLAVCVCAEENDGFTAYPFFDENTVPTEGVSFYHSDGTKVTNEEIAGKSANGWDANALKDAEGNYEHAFWSGQGGWNKFDVGYSQYGGHMEIVFTGTALRLCTGWNNNADNQVKVWVDGDEANAVTVANDGSGAWYEVKDLEDKTHTVTVKVIAVGVEIGYFEIKGELGAKAPEAASSDVQSQPGNATDSASTPAGDANETFDPITVASLVAVVSLAGTAVAVRKKQH